MIPNRLILIAGKDPEREPSGGHSAYARAHARAAQAAGFEPEIYCISNEEGAVDVPYGRLRRVRRNPFRDPPIYEKVKSRAAAWHNVLLCRALCADLKHETRPVIMHGISIWGHAGMRAADRLRKAGTPVRSLIHVYTCYHEEYRSKFQGARRSYDHFQQLLTAGEWVFGNVTISPSEKRIWLQADYCAGNYRSVDRYLTTKYGPRPDYRIVPYAPETAFIPESPNAPRAIPEDIKALQPADAPLIVALSRHDPRKGIDTLIEALALLNQRGVPFRACITSAGDLWEVNQVLARRKGLASEQVSFPGYVRDPADYLSAADVYCLPSIEEHSGSVSLLEAMQAGCACVSSDVDGMPEDVTHEEHALLIPPSDPAALADALQRLLADEALRKQLAVGARRRYEERFSAPAFSKAMGELYQEMLASMERDG